MIYRINRFGTDEPNVESLDTFGVPVADVPETIAESFRPLEDALKPLGFGATCWCVFNDDVNGGVGCLAVLLHESGQALARLWCRTMHGSEDAGEHIALTFISAFDDGTFLMSIASMSDMATPPRMQINQLVGASASELWESHRRKLAADPLNAVAGMASASDVLGLLEEHHQCVHDFYLEHGVFEVPGPEVTATLVDVDEPVDTAAYAAVLAEIERSQTKKPGWGKAIFILGISLLIFFGAGAAAWSWQMVAALIPILLFHEFGHYVAMRVFGYQDLRMFFIPLFGAAVSGRHYNVPGWKKAIVSLAGPVPGIALGAVLGVVAIVANQNWLLQASLFLLLLNGFNLLPFLPLDGGWVAHAILFSRHPSLDAGFRILAAVALILVGLAMGAFFLPLLGMFMLFGVPMAYRIARTAADIRSRGVDTTAQVDHIPTNAACRIIGELRNTLPKGLSDRQLANCTLQVFEAANARPPGWIATLAFGAVYAGCFVVPVLCLLMVAFTMRFGMSGFVDAEPQHALNVEQIRCVEPPVAIPSTGDGGMTIIATFETPEAASGAFDTVSSRLGDSTRLKLFGQTLVLELPAGSEEVREQFVREFKSQDAEVLVEVSSLEGWFALRCVAPNQRIAEEIEKESRHYFVIPAPMQAIPPWAPTLALTDQHRQSRATYERLVHGPELEEDRTVQQLGEQMGEADPASDMAAFKSLQEQYQQHVKKLTEGFRQRLRGMGDEQVDVGLIDLYEKRPQYDSAAAESGTDTESAAKAYSEALQQWNVDVGARLGQLPMVEGDPEPRSGRYSGNGGVEREGMRLTFPYLSFYRVCDGPEALVEWLHAKGCTEFRYGFGGTPADAADRTGWLFD